MSLLVAVDSPTAGPFNTEPVCRISVLVPLPVKCTDRSAPVIVPALRTVPEPSIPINPPLIVAPAPLVTSSVAPGLVKMPNFTPLMVPPLRLFTVAAPVAWRALPIGPVAWILPPFVTLTVFPKMAMPSARMVPPLRLFTVEFPAIARPADSVASMSPEFPVSSIVGANIPAEPPEMIPPFDTVALMLAKIASPPVPVAWIRPELPVTLMVLAETAVPAALFARIVPVALFFTVTSPAKRALPPAFNASIVPAFPMTLMVPALMPFAPPVMMPPMLLVTVAKAPAASAIPPMVEFVAWIKPEFVKTTSPTPAMPAPPVLFDRMTPPALFATVRPPPSALIAVPPVAVASMTLPPPWLFTVPALISIPPAVPLTEAPC